MSKIYEARLKQIEEELENTGKVTCCRCNKQFNSEDSYCLPIVMKFFCEACYESQAELCEGSGKEMV